MRVADLELLYDYGYWANRRLLDAISALSNEEFTRDVAGSYGSIRNTLVHVLSAEWGWLDRSGGHARGPKLRPDEFPDLRSIVETWDEVEGYVRQFFDQLQDDDLRRVVEFDFGGAMRGSVCVGEVLHHGAVHASHHRGQVALLLRELGHAPGNFDILFYYAEKARSTV